MRLSFPQERRSRIALAVAGVLFLGLFVSIWVYLRAVDRERERLAGLDRIVVDVETLTPPDARGVTLWLAEGAPADVEPFGGKVYAATPAGLAVFDTEGRFVRRYTTLDGLPENSITCLERYGDALFAGTLQSGLLKFDGETFTRYKFVRPASTRVTALKATGGELLVGTFDAGLFEFDGTTFTRRYQAAFGEACVRVTSIESVGPRLYAGTHDAGVFEWREGAAANLREAEGLPSDRVTGLAGRDGTLLIATDLGVAELRGNDRAVPISLVPNATGIAVRNGEAFVSSLIRGVTVANGSGLPANAAARPVADVEGAPAMVSTLPTRFVTGLKFEENALWALTDRGLFVCPTLDGPVRFAQFGEADETSRTVSSGHVAALTIDGTGRLWVGMFDGGIDILDPKTGERLDRIDDPELHEINAIAAEPVKDRVWVATSKGLVVFDAGRKTRVYGAREGLVGENVAGLALDTNQPGDLAVATNRGVTLFGSSIGRSLTAFHGLPNNHTYSVAAMEGRVFVGTLGGLAEIDKLRIGRVFTTANSRLPHNWVNALAVLGGNLYAGTYGGGVAVLTPSGELVAFEETAGLEVNPGAMATDGRRLYVGTLSRGLYTYDLDTAAWTRVTRVLSSVNVTAIVADSTYLYIGTEHGITRIERGAIS